MSFDIGDRVYASEWCEGTIVDIEGILSVPAKVHFIS